MPTKDTEAHTQPLEEKKIATLGRQVGTFTGGGKEKELHSDLPITPTSFAPAVQTPDYAITPSPNITASAPLSVKALAIQPSALALMEAKQVNGNTAAKANPIFSVPQLPPKTGSQVRPSNPDQEIALTFDDGPWPQTTQQVLEILKQQNVKATFFCVGEMVQRYPQLAKLIVADGHEIGNHTWHHWYRRMDPDTAANEINSTEALLYKTTGVKTSLFRPPGGILTNGVADYAEHHNYDVVMWSDDSVDYRRPAVSRLVNNVLREARAGGIVLMHDGGGNRLQTVKALPQIIDGLRKRGYRFVTVSELLAKPG